jgi:hypothetical protein
MFGVGGKACDFQGPRNWRVACAARSWPVEVMRGTICPTISLNTSQPWPASAANRHDHLTHEVETIFRRAATSIRDAVTRHKQLFDGAVADPEMISTGPSSAEISVLTSSECKVGEYRTQHVTCCRRMAGQTTGPSRYSFKCSNVDSGSSKTAANLSRRRSPARRRYRPKPSVPARNPSRRRDGCLGHAARPWSGSPHKPMSAPRSHFGVRAHKNRNDGLLRIAVVL